MWRAFAALLFVSFVVSAAAQVGPEGYTPELAEILSGHLTTVQSRARTSRIVTAGVAAALAATTIVGGTLMIIQEDDPFYRMNGILLTIGGGAIGVGSGVMFAVPSQAERDTGVYFQLPNRTEQDRIDRFVIGESILRNLSRWSLTNRVAYGVATGAIAGTFLVYRGWIFGGVFAGAAGATLAIPGVPEREWRAYRRETTSEDVAE
jgi:hypothetical protein